jgi:hypothetical protein
MSSGDETRAEVVNKFRGEVGVDPSKEEPLDNLLDTTLESAELKLADRP